MFGLGMPELLLIAFVILLLFGARRIPELMKGLGQGVKNFKEGMNSAEPAKKADEGTERGAERKAVTPREESTGESDGEKK